MPRIQTCTAMYKSYVLYEFIQVVIFVRKRTSAETCESSAKFCSFGELVRLAGGAMTFSRRSRVIRPWWSAACHTTTVARPGRVFGPARGPSMGSNMFLPFRAPSDLRIATMTNRAFPTRRKVESTEVTSRQSLSLRRDYERNHRGTRLGTSKSPRGREDFFLRVIKAKRTG
jgi:hypothetical protein